MAEPTKTRLLASVLEAIGQTPVVELSRIARGYKGRIVAKLDYLNPAGSKKDLIARHIIETAERSGALKPGQTIVEVTSGNTGNGVAMVCAVKGYPFVAVMSKGNSVERAAMTRAMGGEVILVDQAPGHGPGSVTGDDLGLVEATAAKVTESRGAFRVDQFSRETNVEAHFLHSGPQLLAATGGRIDAFCDLVGTGGSFTGVARSFKQANPSIRCYVVEPKGSEALAGCLQSCCTHLLQGAGYGRANLPLVDRGLIDGFLAVTDEEAVAGTKALARSEGIFAGMTAGANVAAALQLLRKGEEGTIAISICDSGMKYFSTGVWDTSDK
ncbi:PLP-dependent cysteine synthase family protein [Nibricoccus sp. IMCC34717]|uniref:PLP-dependent cysteine synthase family protein n=1 Tax=Nibricoccus sp. IMCC34717 TaxID=3034021 RepID=UPI00384F20D2